MSNITPAKYVRKVHPIQSDELITEQSHKDECDINTILKRYEATGRIDHHSQYAPMYGDFTQLGLSNFQEVMNVITEAQEMFLSVPSAIRARFNNDPGAYLDFALDPANRSEMANLGLPTDHLSPYDTHQAAPETRSRRASDLPATPVAPTATNAPETPV